MWGKVRWALIVETVLGSVVSILGTIAIFITSSVMVLAFIWGGLPVVLSSMAILLVVISAPLPDWDDNEQPQYITPENRQRLISYMRTVRAKCRKQG